MYYHYVVERHSRRRCRRVCDILATIPDQRTYTISYIHNVSAKREKEGKNSTVGVKIGTRLSEKAPSAARGDVLHIVFTRTTMDNRAADVLQEE